MLSFSGPQLLFWNLYVFLRKNQLLMVGSPLWVSTCYWYNTSSMAQFLSASAFSDEMGRVQGGMAVDSSAFSNCLQSIFLSLAFTEIDVELCNECWGLPPRITFMNKKLFPEVLADDCSQLNCPEVLFIPRGSLNQMTD